MIIASIFFACDFLSPQSAKAAEAGESVDAKKQADSHAAHAQADLILAKALLARLKQSATQDDLTQWLTLQAVIIGAAIGFAPSALIITPAISSEKLADQIELASVAVAGLGDHQMHMSDVRLGFASAALFDARALQSGEAIKLYLPPLQTETHMSAWDAASAGVFTARLLASDQTGDKTTASLAADRDVLPASAQPQSLRAQSSVARQIIDARQAGSSIALDGQASTQVTGLAEIDNPIIILAGAQQRLALEFTPLISAAQVEQKIALQDAAQLILDSVAINRLLPSLDKDAPAATAAQDPVDVSLNVSSDGAKANSLLLGDQLTLPGALNINVSGSADLSIYEKAALFQQTNVDGRSFAGYLTFAVDLGGDQAAYNLIAVGASNYQVTPNNSLALMNLPNKVEIKISTDLNKLILGFSGDSQGLLASAMLHLADNIAIRTIETINVPLLDLVSGNKGVNKIASIQDANLSKLTLNGAADISIHELIARNSASLVVDSRNLQGALTIDLTDPLAADHRVILFQSGASANIVTDLTRADRLIYISGAGNQTIVLSAGDINDTFVDLKVGDKIALNGASAPNTIINALYLDQSVQARIDAQSNLIAAAEKASQIANSPLAHQAVLFLYKDNSYVFLDSDGSHIFQSNADAILNLVGSQDMAKLTSVFWS
ncbi:MAG: hypothetical protein EBY21_04030 [Alphaproteobacteria bacterium]|nr:hypothetical protein [Alphaproteobacteria bacterium]